MAEKDSSINYQFTKAGHDLAVQALAGTTQLDFTRAVTSTDNHFTDTEADTLAITELANVEQTIDLNEVDVVDDDPSFVKVPVVINKADMEADYNLLTIGLYCKPKDGDEVLYSVCAMQDPIYMHKSSNNSTYSIDLNTLVGSATNVTIKVDPAGMITNATFDAFKATLSTQYALKSDLANAALTDKANVFSEQQTLAGGAVDSAGNKYVTEDKVPKPDLSGYALTADLPDFSKFATTESMTKAIAAIPKVDLTPYAKSADVDAKLDAKANTTDVVGIDPNTSQITNTTVKANAGQILIAGQPAISLVQSADDATALTESSNDAVLHFTVEE